LPRSRRGFQFFPSCSWAPEREALGLLKSLARTLSILSQLQQDCADGGRASEQHLLLSILSQLQQYLRKREELLKNDLFQFFPSCS
jgi:hypothetical protein